MEDLKETTLTILATSDIHGYIYPTDYRKDSDKQWGLAKLATVIKSERQLDSSLLLIDNGDLIQGSPMASYYAKEMQDQVHPAIRALNALQYDAAVIGNHEFNFGRALLDKAIRDSKFPWLTANIIDSETGEPAFGKPYVVKHVRGVKIVILGLTTSYIPNWELPEHISGLKFIDSLQAIRTWVDHIREKEKPDVLVASYHGGFERDLNSGEWLEEDTGENQGYAICKEIDGIDVLITGHQHRRLAQKLLGVAVVQPGCNGEALAKIQIHLSKTKEKWHIQQVQTELLAPSTEADKDILAFTREEEKRTQAWLDRPLGSAKGNWLISDPFQARLSEHPFVELMNRIQMEAANVRISCTAIMHNEAPGFNSQITIRDILANYPYANTLQVLRLSGDTIRLALEHSATYFTLDQEGKPTVHPSFLEPKAQHYNYDMWEGIEYELDIRRPPGKRVVKLQFEGKPLDPAATYDVVMNHYRAGGGGGYSFFQGKPVIREIQTDMADLFVDYIIQHPILEATCNHNWRILY